MRELREGVWWIDCGGVNAYLVDDDGTFTLIDAGLPWNRGRIRTAVSEVAGSLSAIDRVLVTHYDIDHVGTLAKFDGLDASIHIGQADADFLTGERSPPWRNHKGAVQRAFGWLTDPPTNPVELVEDGDELGSFTAHHTPGHTPGHTVYVSEDPSTVILGDLVRESGGRFSPSPYVISYDTSAVRSSLRSLAEELPAVEVAAPGHGVPFKRGGSDRVLDCARGLAGSG
jgi:glyoxylase-like metal-dependent hydrolase (beta-lactamase superfamily II)